MSHQIDKRFAGGIIEHFWKIASNEDWIVTSIMAIDSLEGKLPEVAFKSLRSNREYVTASQNIIKIGTIDKLGLSINRLPILINLDASQINQAVFKMKAAGCTDSMMITDYDPGLYKFLCGSEVINLNKSEYDLLVEFKRLPGFPNVFSHSRDEKAANAALKLVNKFEITDNLYAELLLNCSATEKTIQAMKNKLK